MPRIRVAIRLRPDSGHTLQEFTYSSGPDKASSVAIVAAGVKNEFSYDCVFSPDTTQEEIFGSCAEKILSEVLEGYNATLFAYGQTGTSGNYNSVMLLRCWKDIHDYRS